MCDMADSIDEPGEREAADGVADLAALRSHCSRSFKSSCSSGPASVYDSVEIVIDQILNHHGC